MWRAFVAPPGIYPPGRKAAPAGLKPVTTPHTGRGFSHPHSGCTQSRGAPIRGRRGYNTSTLRFCGCSRQKARKACASGQSAHGVCLVPPHDGRGAGRAPQEVWHQCSASSLGVFVERRGQSASLVWSLRALAEGCSGGQGCRRGLSFSAYLVGHLAQLLRSPLGRQRVVEDFLHAIRLGFGLAHREDFKVPV